MHHKLLLPRLAAFAVLLLSFSLLVRSAPSPASLDGVVRPDSYSLGSKPQTPTQHTRAMLLALRSDVRTQITKLNACAKNPKCNPKLVLDGMANKIQTFTSHVGRSAREGEDMQPGELVKLWMELCAAVLKALDAKAKFTVALCAKLANTLCEFVKLLLMLIDRAPGGGDGPGGPGEPGDQPGEGPGGELPPPPSGSDMPDFPAPSRVPAPPHQRKIHNFSNSPVLHSPSASPSHRYSSRASKAEIKKVISKYRAVCLKLGFKALLGLVGLA